MCPDPTVTLDRSPSLSGPCLLQGSPRLLWGPAAAIPVMATWGSLSWAECKPQIMQAKPATFTTPAPGQKETALIRPAQKGGSQVMHAGACLRQKPSCHPEVLGV